jgi:hypothetical protein
MKECTEMQVGPHVKRQLLCVFIHGICKIRTCSANVTIFNGYLLNINAMCVMVIVGVKTQGTAR